jgi:hypothetical protein
MRYLRGSLTALVSAVTLAACSGDSQSGGDAASDAPVVPDSSATDSTTTSDAPTTTTDARADVPSDAPSLDDATDATSADGDTSATESGPLDSAADSATDSSPSEVAVSDATGDVGTDVSAAPDSVGEAAADSAETMDAATLGTVAITAPADNLHTKGTITVQIVATGSPSSVDLLLDGVVITTETVIVPFAIDTTTLSEGTHMLTARGHFSGGDVTSAPIHVIVDRTAPTIVAQTPSIGATNVRVSAPITVTFSEPMLATSITSSAISLTAGGSAVPFTHSLSADGKTLTLTTTGPTDGPIGFSIAFGATATDLAGNALDGTTTWTWNAPLWFVDQAPTISADSGSSFALAIGNSAVAATGAVFWDVGHLDPSNPPIVPGLGEQLRLGVPGAYASVAPIVPAPRASETGSVTYTLSSAGTLVAVESYYNGATASIRSVPDLWNGSSWTSSTAPPSGVAVWQDTVGQWWAYETSTAAGMVAVTVSQLTGSAWSTVATLKLATGSQVFDLHVEPGGNVFVSSFTQSGSAPATFDLQQWNGTSWSTLATGGYAGTAGDQLYSPAVSWSAGVPTLAICNIKSGGSTYDDYLLSASSGSWKVLGGGALATSLTQPDLPVVATDRFARIYGGAANGVRALSGGAWGAVLGLPATGTTPSSIFEMPDPAGAVAYATLSGTGVTAAPTTGFLRLNR